MTKSLTLKDLMAVTDEMLEELFSDPDFPAMADELNSYPSEQAVSFLMQYAGSFELAKMPGGGRVALFNN